MGFGPTLELLLCGWRHAQSLHGPGAETFTKTSHADPCKPDVVRDTMACTMAFMFETRLVWRPTIYAIGSAQPQHGRYRCYRCWQGLQKHFNPEQK